jgi:hypothetical protein
MLPAGILWSQYIFIDLQMTGIDVARIKQPNPIHFMMAINWLMASYNTKEELAGSFKVVEKTVHTTSGQQLPTI